MAGLKKDSAVAAVVVACLVASASALAPPTRREVLVGGAGTLVALPPAARARDEQRAQRAADVAASARSQAQSEVAERLVSAQGLGAWKLPTGDMQAIREGDAAMSQAVSALGAKDFEACFAAVEAARAAYGRAGGDALQSRGVTLEQIVSSLRVERERAERLKRLAVLKRLKEQEKEKERDGPRL